MNLLHDIVYQSVCLLVMVVSVHNNLSFGVDSLFSQLTRHGVHNYYDRFGISYNCVNSPIGCGVPTYITGVVGFTTCIYNT